MGASATSHAHARARVLSPCPATERLLTVEELTALCKRRGFAFPSSDIYGGVGAGFDYGPLGAQLKKNVADAWWCDFVTRRRDCVGLDSAIILNPKGEGRGAASGAACRATSHPHRSLESVRPRGQVHRPRGGLSVVQEAQQVRASGLPIMHPAHLPVMARGEPPPPPPPPLQYPLHSLPPLHAEWTRCWRRGLRL
jgi:hypothetical protein